MAPGHGEAVGIYAGALSDTPLTWIRMRQVYALLGLAKTSGPERVDAACARALDAEAISVSLIGRMLERATEKEPPAAASPATAPAGRFAPDADHFAVAGQAAPRRHRRRCGGSAPTPTVSPELRALLRRVKLGRTLDTLPERVGPHRRHGSRRVHGARAGRRSDAPGDVERHDAGGGPRGWIPACAWRTGTTPRQ